jgi:hypothetical protein
MLERLKLAGNFLLLWATLILIATGALLAYFGALGLFR